MLSQSSAQLSFPNPEFYTWKNYRCAYEYYPALDTSLNSDIPLLLIHPIGVGLSKQFWHRFCQQWREQGFNNSIYNPDLLGCGDSEMPRVAYYPQDWAEQLNYFLETVIQKPVIIIVQGALLPVAIALAQLQKNSNLIKGLILGCPPAWKVMTDSRSEQQQKFAWNLFFDSPIGSLFWLYARRREFVKSFSIRQLFAEEKNVDQNWLDLLGKGATDAKSRYAVYAFLAGFWRQNYAPAMAEISVPTLAVFGTTASSISRSGFSESPEQRCQLYEQGWKHLRSCLIPGRNVLPYESTSEFVKVTAEFVEEIKRF